MSNWLNILLFISLGFILLIIELFTPGFGITGIGGLFLLSLGCFFAYKISMQWGILISFASIALIVIFFKLFLKSGLWRKMQLNLRETKEEGYVSALELKGLVGKTGKTISILRPTGVALIEERRIEVVAESGVFIDKDKTVQVTRVQENKVFVKAI